MTAAVLTQLSLGLLVLVPCLLLGWRRARAEPMVTLLLLGIYLADCLLLDLTNRYEPLRLIPTRVWDGFLICNWSGKLYSVLLVLALVAVVRGPLDRAVVGLTLRQRTGWRLPSLAVLAALAAWATAVGLSSPQGPWDPATLAYLAVMPGLNEELVYRGALPALIDRLVPGRVNLLGASLGWGLATTTVLFALLHGVWLDAAWSVRVDLIALRNAAVTGLAFAWLRARTGSLLLPVAAHGLVDFLFFLPRMV